MSRVPVMLTIAGSDPSGGAGIQADLKTATTLGVYGASVLTALTAQNTTGVTAIHPVPADFVTAQLDAVLGDLDVRAVKIGMLGSPEVVGAVAAALRRYEVEHVVLDPVMVATSGDRLVPEETVAAIRDELLALSTLVTPNLPEAGALLEVEPPADPAAMAACAERLRGLGASAALVKGGHLDGTRSLDVLVDGDGAAEFDSDRVATTNTHGTGCTLSSAIASLLLRPMLLRDAVREAKAYLTGSLVSGARMELGTGNGPVDHLWRTRDEGTQR